MLPEELAIVDLLTKPDITLTDKEKLEVKKVEKALLETLKQEKHWCWIGAGGSNRRQMSR